MRVLHQNSLLEVRFNSSNVEKHVNLYSDIYSENIIINQPTNIQDDLVMNGWINGDNSTIDLSEVENLTFVLTDLTTSLPGLGQEAALIMYLVLYGVEGEINITDDSRAALILKPGGNPFVLWSILKEY